MDVDRTEQAKRDRRRLLIEAAGLGISALGFLLDHGAEIFDLALQLAQSLALL